jgi:isoleucyl-tRNA synthetase
MDYKDTLNLPRTDFPMKADLVTREPQRLEKWQAANLYGKIQEVRAGQEKFVLHDGPPFANGDVHIGTALNKILKDIIIKYQTIRGKHAPYVPGWDCHGLPIEFKVSQEMREEFEASWSERRKEHEEEWNKAVDPKAAEQAVKTQALNQFMAPEKVRTRCESEARKFIDIQRTQFKRLGVFGDWENPYLTLDKKYEADELRLFADVVEKGFVYRAKKPVYWCITCRTALAEAEVEYANHVSPSIYVKFPVVGQRGVNIVIWTTTPWTLPANLAVAYNKDFQYVQVAVGDEKFILFRGLLPAVAEKCGWTGYTETPFPTEHLKTIQYQHPFIPTRIGRAFAADFVTSDTGTGFVHIAPGHGMDDYQLGLANGLPIYSPVHDDGGFTYTNDLPQGQQMPVEMVGKSILEKHGKSDANEAVLHELRDRNALLKQEDFHHSYPHCWRSKNPVIFRAMDQWFIRIDHRPGESDPELVKTFNRSGVSDEEKHRLGIVKTFRGLALDAINAVNWIPDWGKNRIEGAVKSRPDWCISRQRSWGVPIPAFFDGKEWILKPELIRKLAAWFERKGSNAWFATHDARQLLVDAEAHELIEPDAWTDALQKSKDTLDVWIDSGSSSRAVTARRKELVGGGKPFQADMYLEGSDQHRGWFQSSLLLSLAGNGAPPYKTVLTHGFMVDTSREKVSKSKGAMAITAFVERFGADVVRLWSASQDFRGDLMITLDKKKIGWEMRMEKVGETYRVIRNALRYQLSNLYDFDPTKNSVADQDLTGLDRWILGEFAKLESEVRPAYDAYEFHVVYQKVSQFAAVELSAMYHDTVKDRLYTDAANSPRRRSTQTALYRLVIGLCEMLSPILAFTADEAWEFIPGSAGLPFVHLATWQPSALERSAAERDAWEGLFKVRGLVLPSLEKERQGKTIGKSLDARVTLTGSDPLLVDAKTHLAALRELLNVSQLEVHAAPSSGEPTLEIVVSKALGQKCERCWHWEEDVGAVKEHPTICGRCVEAVSASS